MHLLGHQQVGTGPLRVLVLNDWIGDTSTWESAKAYLNGDALTWVFADVRGYGRSRGFAGRYCVEESVADVLRLADHLGWDRFAVVGHSMSTLIALHLAQHFSDRIQRVVLLTPPPPTGFGADDAMLAQFRQVALGDDAHRMAALKAMWGDQLSDGWVAYKVARWRAAADPEAVAGYIAMFAKDGLPNPKARVRIPVMAVTGELDAPPMRQAAVSPFLSPICDTLTIVPLAECGHYPMQEMPPLLVATVERFLRNDSLG
jgi:3-oxoadipate enol-lactonase